MATRRAAIIERYNTLTEGIASRKAELAEMEAEAAKLTQELKDTPADILDADPTESKNAYLRQQGLLK